MTKPESAPNIVVLSSRLANDQGTNLGDAYLNPLLMGATSYDRIAGYFSTALMQVAGEAIENLSGKARIVCNAQVHGLDRKDALANNDPKRIDDAIITSWNKTKPLALSKTEVGRARLKKLHDLIIEQKIEVRVVTDDHVGFVHGKGGIVRYESQPARTFNGSVNETKNGWEVNYEILWDTANEETVNQMQSEFDFLWDIGVPLPVEIVEDIAYLANRTEFDSVESWRKHASTRGTGQTLPVSVSAPFKEMPIEQGIGLQDHQKFFIRLGFEYQRYDRLIQNNEEPLTGMRFILADQVGLGKTVQMGACAILAALYGQSRVLILAPKSLCHQWHKEMQEKFAIPVGCWDGSSWILEGADKPRASGLYNLGRWPRRIGIVSTGIFNNGLETDNVKQLLKHHYGMIVVDEAHKASAKIKDGFVVLEESSNAYQGITALIKGVSAHKGAEHVILGTATPVQLANDESWALLNLLSLGPRGKHILGTGKWQNATAALSMIKSSTSNDISESWEWFRNPAMHPIVSRRLELVYGNGFPLFQLCMNSGLPRKPARLAVHSFDHLEDYAQETFKRSFDNYRRLHNPLLEYTVFRTRRFLEDNGALSKVAIQVHGDDESGAVVSSDLMQKAFTAASDFSEKIGRAKKGAGFIKTLLLRRLGSSVAAAACTAAAMLESDRWLQEAYDPEVFGYDLESEDLGKRDKKKHARELQLIFESARLELEQYAYYIAQMGDDDPKYDKLLNILREEHWDNDNVILFTEYFDTANYIAFRLCKDYPGIPIPIYSSDDKSGYWEYDGENEPEFKHQNRDTLKQKAEAGDFRFFIGTNAAQEGLNLQEFSRLINIDLPWNPARLEQRKGRIQRMTQKKSLLHVYNMRYEGSVEDRVLNKLKSRLGDAYELFGAVPETLGAELIEQLTGGTIDENSLGKKLNAAADKIHPFKEKYEREYTKEELNWNDAYHVLPLNLIQAHLRKPI